MFNYSSPNITNVISTVKCLYSVILVESALEILQLDQLVKESLHLLVLGEEDLAGLAMHKIDSVILFFTTICSLCSTVI